MNVTTDPELTQRLGTPERMRQIASYYVFDPILQSRLDAVARNTAELLHAPVSLVSVLLDSAQFVLGSHGTPDWMAAVQGNPAEWALCTQTVLTGGPYVVLDAAADPLHADNPMVTTAGLRSYAGVPLTDDSGHVLGAHCVIDIAARSFDDADIAVLSDGAAESLRLLADYRVG